MDKVCGVYCIENMINNKRYIGQSVDIYKRWKHHKNELNNGKHHNYHLQSSWNSYGESCFKFYILENCDISLLDNREIYYINFYNTKNCDYGYNLNDGGSGNQAPSYEIRRRMSENHADVSGENNPNYGKHMSEETKRKMIANRNTCKGKDHPNYGKPLSNETKEKLSKIRKGMHAGSKHPRCRSIYCPELNRIFWGAAEVEEIFGIDRTYISACLSGRQKSAGKHPVTGEKLHWFDANEINLNI